MVNNVTLVGRLAADPELKYTPSGAAVCSFRLAVDRRFRNDKGDKETDFFSCVAWKQTAEFVANYTGKGRLIALTGRLQQRQWTDKEGQKRSVVEVVADSVDALDKKQTETETIDDVFD